jgi:succinoglycan biosynthesis protein ExoM
MCASGSTEANPAESRSAGLQVSAPTVVVGICTANRLERLQALLSSLHDLDLVRRVPDSVTVVVADNSPHATARLLVETFAARSPLRVEYLHVERPSLSLARNGVLDAAARFGQLLAMIDDDELPEPGWLDELMECRERTGSPLVVGPVIPRFDDGAPAWLRQGGFLDLAAYPEDAVIRDGITGNALVHLPTLGSLGIRFDERFGQSGGEDQLFFRHAAALGADIRFAARAAVYEAVPPERTTLRYLVRRELRKGNTLGLLARDHRELGEGPMRRLAAAVKWFAGGVLLAAAGVAGGGGIRLRRGLLRATRAVGMIGGLAGWRYIAY